MSQLSPEQLAQVESWASDGANLNTVQERLKTEFGITLTYLDARLLMLDVGVRIKDKPREAPKPAAPASSPAAVPPDEDAGLDEDFDAASPEMPAGAGIQMSADQIAIPGALISGKVTFSDGTNASWFLDQMGRLGLNGAPQGYQPPPADVPAFQQQLDLLLQKSGF